MFFFLTTFARCMEMRYEKEDLQRAPGVLREGGVILYPTDTVWGIGCDATNEKAVAKVFEIKRRSEAKSLVLLASDLDMVAKYIKETTPNSKVIFIGPCTAKKKEAQLESVKPHVDSVMTFEELQALYDSRNIDIMNLEEDVLDNASYFGRIFARSGGLSDAVAQAMKEQNIDFDLKAVPCDGIEACRVALLKASKNLLDGNFIEGMAAVVSTAQDV